MYNSLIRCAAAVFFIAAFAVVVFSAFKTAKTIRESIGQMVRNDADIKKAAQIVKKVISGKGEKGDAGEIVRSVCGLKGGSFAVSGREIPDLYRI
ncbi:MAG: hypothetical protein IJS65_08695 [Clostridia bacterium]|nr:hypothetical protein [Clostridia bacterium]